jgi:exodeoxyribonuclease VII large subunit
VLARGFALVRDLDGRPLRVALAVAAGQRIDIEFSDGRVRARAEQPSAAALDATAPSEPASDVPAKPRRRGGGEPGQGSLFG